MYQNEIEIIKSRIENKHQGDEKQLEIIFSPNKRLLVEAPAGYGKTHTMVSRIAYLISIGKLPVPKKLLALTFSVNAAYKIKKDVSKNIPELLQDLGKQINIKEKYMYLIIMVSVEAFKKNTVIDYILHCRI